MARVTAEESVVSVRFRREIGDEVPLRDRLRRRPAAAVAFAAPLPDPDQEQEAGGRSYRTLVARAPQSSWEDADVGSRILDEANADRREQHVGRRVLQRGRGRRRGRRRGRQYRR